MDRDDLERRGKLPKHIARLAPRAAAVEHSAAALGVNPPSRVGRGNRGDEAGVGHGRGISSDEVGEITWAGPLYAA